MTTSTLATLTIGGEPQPGAAGSYCVHNPARPAEIVGHAPAADRAQLEAAVSAARNAAPGWRALDVAERVAKVTAAATTAAEQLKANDGARLYTSEHGKVLAEAGFEIDTAPMVDPAREGGGRASGEPGAGVAAVSGEAAGALAHEARRGGGA